MRIRELLADHYRVPLPVALSDSTHGVIEGFDLITVRLRDADGAEGVGEIGRASCRERVLDHV